MRYTVADKVLKFGSGLDLCPRIDVREVIPFEQGYLGWGMKSDGFPIFPKKERVFTRYNQDGNYWGFEHFSDLMNFTSGLKKLAQTEQEERRDKFGRNPGSTGFMLSQKAKIRNEEMLIEGLSRHMREGDLFEIIRLPLVVRFLEYRFS
jgi:hypothetical protein